MKMAVTTIQIQTETRNLLKRISAKGETYDDVIREMAAAYQAYLTEQLRKLDEDEFIPAEEVFSAIETSLSQRRSKNP